ncbi:hypothetical protein BSZ22_01880 [Bradyrhizobium canariense]|nr:hypothetical protein BSZ22_01880 [Bradyrhizobium canariense]OSI82435.1 hypothetical protein BSZ23_01535 [Bradyrhizobium canariense]
MLVPIGKIDMKGVFPGVACRGSDSMLQVRHLNQTKRLVQRRRSKAAIALSSIKGPSDPLDDFVAIAGFHRKHAMRLLRHDSEDQTERRRNLDADSVAQRAISRAR